GAPLLRIATALDDLRATAPGGGVRQWLWVAAAWVEALMEATEPELDDKKQLGRIEQHLKKLAEEGDRPATAVACEQSVKALLYALGRSGRGTGPRAQEVWDAFQLRVLFQEPSAEGADADTLPPPEILRSVSIALAKEIEGVQDLFSIYLDPEHLEAKSLESLRELLAKISRTLHMLGLELLRSLVDEVLAVVTAVDQGTLALSDALSMRVAAAMLQLEQGARDLQGVRSARRQIEEQITALRALRGEGTAPGIDGLEITDAVLTDGEFKQLLTAVDAEIRANLVKVEESFEAFSRHPDGAEVAAGIPAHLTQVQGALQILGQDRAAELAAVIGQHVLDLIQGSVRAAPRVFEALAVGIGTLGAYLDGLERGRTSLPALVDLALQDIDDALRESAAAAPLAPADTRAQLRALLKGALGAEEARSLRAHILEMRAGISLDARTARLAGEVDRLLAFIESDPGTLSDTVRETLERSVEALLDACTGTQASPTVGDAIVATAVSSAPSTGWELVPEEQLEAAAPPSSTGETAVEVPAVPAPVPALETDLDPEIMGYFIEDAQEVYANIQRSLALWRENVDDREALAELRRGFHTLKGSGRMVGASDIAELAWDIEVQLNQVREGRLERTDAMLVLLADVQDALPPLIKALEGTPADVDVAALRARAQAITRGTSIETVDDAEGGLPDNAGSTVAAAVPPVTEPAGEVSAQAAVPSMPAAPAVLRDTVLLQIFASETRNHLAVVREASQQPGDVVGAGLLRAVHTLQGSARAVGLSGMADCCFDLEKLLQTMEQTGVPLGPEDSAGLEDLAELVQAVVDALLANVMPDEAVSEGFAARAAHWRAQLGRLAPVARSADVPGLQPVDAQEPQVPAVADAPPAAFAPPAKLPPAQVPPADAAPDLMAPPVEVDQELVEIFRDEATDILEVLEQ
ncbi:MAG TPA: Hpt domain-containing protein, partial [Acidiferrobacteraceae bacterium]|nr:Hpt domain-containing protein [Acidiferrobacteraceae bacterium]